MKQTKQYFKISERRGFTEFHTGLNKTNVKNCRSFNSKIYNHASAGYKAEVYLDLLYCIQNMELQPV